MIPPDTPRRLREIAGQVKSIEETYDRALSKATRDVWDPTRCCWVNSAGEYDQHLFKLIKKERRRSYLQEIRPALASTLGFLAGLEDPLIAWFDSFHLRREKRAGFLKDLADAFGLLTGEPEGTEKYKRYYWGKATHPTDFIPWFDYDARQRIQMFLKDAEQGWVA
jgi:hypothetical protein